MKVRWSPAAVEDFLRIVEYIHRESPDAAHRIAKTIHEGAGLLKLFPHRGRQGRMDGTRELLLLPLPFIIVYRVKSDAVEIANIVHGAQRWPPQS
ncbi:MAG: type II toxin-antitoxin system mRNA interferase toxin, RelE/StbE family [Acidobacteria bacterium]|nr:MAG: type II toxin-antitoxin system mRNA interferase toxin, RelE/StbE family [Acidobacteriota bacterium]